MEDGRSSEGRFKTLWATSRVISTLGWITISGGTAFSVIAAAAVLNSRKGTLLVAAVAAAPGFLAAVSGWLIVAAGQLISCFISIEQNTRASSKAQDAILKALGRTPSPSANAPVHYEPAAGAASDPPASQRVACPKCQEAETVTALYDVKQYRKFDADDKSGFGFQSVSLTCRTCGQVFRI